MWRLSGVLLMVVCVGVSQAWADTGKAVLQGTTEGSTITGTVLLTDSQEGLSITAEVQGAQPGKHGFHIHQFGDCSNGGKAAGGHFNPDRVGHGYLPTDGFSGAHAGDLGNLEIEEDGTGTLTLTVPVLALNGHDHVVAGRAFVLHDQPDDFGQPTGNAGARIGCGAIVITGQ